jgi:GNAT superfamily N-acetyltransferase
LSIAVIRYSERPELWDETEALSRAVWPEHNFHGPVLGSYWNRLFDDWPAYQLALLDDDAGGVVAEGHTLPCPWDGSPEGLGEGIDAMTVAAFEAAASGREPTALCAMAAEVNPRFQGSGLADRVLEAMSQVAREAGLGWLIAPVRPSFKDRYPITPIERYVAWTRADGEPFDPWIRIHTRRGGRIVKPIPRSLLITGTVGEWEQWTGMKFPESGEYTFPAGLAPVGIDRRQDVGTYWEPNVWIVHRIG